MPPRGVALRKESVDRNGLGFCYHRDDVVALRKESVDRNKIRIAPIDSIIVALRKESVDRNSPLSLLPVSVWWSLSARRAWIEIGLSFARKIRPVGRSPQGERG